MLSSNFSRKQTDIKKTLKWLVAGIHTISSLLLARLSRVARAELASTRIPAPVANLMIKFFVQRQCAALKSTYAFSSFSMQGVPAYNPRMIKAGTSAKT
jgi:hypothetical protein